MTAKDEIGPALTINDGVMQLAFIAVYQNAAQTIKHAQYGGGISDEPPTLECWGAS